MTAAPGDPASMAAAGRQLRALGADLEELASGLSACARPGIDALPTAATRRRAKALADAMATLAGAAAAVGDGLLRHAHVVAGVLHERAAVAASADRAGLDGDLLGLDRRPGIIGVARAGDVTATEEALATLRSRFDESEAGLHTERLGMTSTLRVQTTTVSAVADSLR